MHFQSDFYCMKVKDDTAYCLIEKLEISSPLQFICFTYSGILQHLLEPFPFIYSQLATQPSALYSMVPCHDWDLSWYLLLCFHASAVVVFNVS